MLQSLQQSSWEISKTKIHHLKRIHSTVDFNVFFQRSFTTTENTQWSLTYKVFIPLGSLYINTETLKKGFFSLETRNTFTNGHIYVGAINIINCYDIIWKRGTIFFDLVYLASLLLFSGISNRYLGEQENKDQICASTLPLYTLITAIFGPTSDAETDYSKQTLITGLFDQSKRNDNDRLETNRYVLS